MEEPAAPSRLSIVVPPSAAGERLDRFLPAALAAEGHALSRSAVQSLIRAGAVSVAGRDAKPRHALAGGEEIDVEIAAPAPTGPPQGEAIPLAILHEDEHLVVVDKPAGLVVHPAAGNPDGTLVNALLHHCGGRLCELAGDDRPGIVHRLDKETSGCLVAAKSELAYRSLVAQFSARETGKEYLAVVEGRPTEPVGTLVSHIGRHPVNRQRMAVVDPPAGKEAVTDYALHRSDGGGAWTTLVCIIHTGRTHQIRVHLRELLRCPILGDTLYAQVSRQRTKVGRLMLHARVLSFLHPASGERLRLEAPPPPEFDPFL